ncbi:hypothetical protein, partial [Pasteurella atlantica]|uniref:hypothetical protein n=1 Tax=Pasteurella atlantica TaxID=2827233 RepID=UPI0027513C1A
VTLSMVPSSLISSDTVTVSSLPSLSVSFLVVISSGVPSPSLSSSVTVDTLGFIHCYYIVSMVLI